MLAGDHVTRGKQGAGALAHVCKIEEEFLSAPGAEREIHRRVLLRAAVDRGHAAAAVRLAVTDEFPSEFDVGEVCEEAFVENVEFSVSPAAPDVLVAIRNLGHMGIGHAVRIHEAVVAEIGVGGIVIVEIAAVFIDRFSVFADSAYALVHEVPDEASLIFGILADKVHVFHETALGIAHRVGVFTLDERTDLGGILAVFLHAGIVQVHGTVDVGEVEFLLEDGALVLDRTAGVLGLDPFVGVHEIGARAGLVAEGPEDDRRVVVVALDIALVALQVGFRIERVLGEGLGTIAHSVRFYVGLGHHIEAVAVAEFVPVRIVGIVAGAYGVQVVFLEEPDVLEHALAGHHVAAVRIEFVTVGALEEHGLPVHEHLGVLDLDLADAGLDGDHLGHGALLQVADLHGIEIRSLRGPFLRIRDFKDRSALALAAYLLGFQGFARRAEKLDGEAGGSVNLDRKRAVGIGGVEVGGDAHVGDVLLRAGIEIAVAGDSAEAPEVLALDIGAVAPAEYLEGYEVGLSGLHQFRDVEFAFQLAVLAVSRELAVDPEIDIGSDGTEVEYHLAAFPGVRNGDLAAVGAYVIVLDWSVRRVVLVVAVPGIARVDVERVAIAVKFPDSRDRHAPPRGIVVVRSPESSRAGIRIGNPVELPYSIDGQIIVRGFRSPLGRFRRLECKPGGVHGKAVHLIYVRIFPFIERLRLKAQGGPSKEGDGNRFSQYHLASVLIVAPGTLSIMPSGRPSSMTWMSRCGNGMVMPLAFKVLYIISLASAIYMYFSWTSTICLTLRSTELSPKSSNVTVMPFLRSISARP